MGDGCSGSAAVRRASDEVYRTGGFVALDEEKVGKLRVEDEVGDDGLEKGKVSHDGEKDKGLSAERGEGGETPVKEPINE